MNKAALALPLCLALAACEAQPPADATGGDVERGRRLVADYGCGACHAIPGVPGARGAVGPALDGFGRRALLAGVLPNTPANLVAWLLDPPAIAPQTGMPAVGLDEREARDVARFLLTLGARPPDAPQQPVLPATGPAPPVQVPGRTPWLTP
jgi:cytochrome c2